MMPESCLPEDVCQHPETKGCFYSLKGQSATLGPDLPYPEDNINFAINVIENVRPWRHFSGMSLKFPSNKQQEDRKSVV